DQVQKGIVEVVRDEDFKNTLKHYIPHHEKLTPKKTTTKLRIVFDASAKTRKKYQSLNESLHRGPVILEDLCGLLLRFRLHKVALVADVEKAFLQVGLQPDDRDVTRFLRLKDPSMPTVENNVQILRFTRVPFGMISSPFLLAATIKNHLTKAGTPIAHQIADNMYVDNMITDVETSTQADELYEEAKTLFQSASMNLGEWASNSSEFLQNIPECDRTSAETVKVLGTSWNLTTDTIFINGCHNLSSNVNTKREALQSVSRIYDPLGLFSPAKLNAKLFIQELWKQEKHWDETFSQSSHQEWNMIYESLTPLSSRPLPRYVGGDEHKLFCFTDVSAKAYSAALYLYSSVNGKATVNLVFSKARVAPAKQLSIPRLELLGGLIGTRCLNYATQQLQLSEADRFLWTDSQCVLHWITTCKPLPVFLQNRLREITSHRDIKFDYVSTSQNPADLSTRGVCLGIGTTLASFQDWGRRASKYELLRISVATGANRSAFSFKSQAGMPSGPEALAGLRAMSFFKTLNSVTAGVLVYCTANETPESNGVKDFIGARKALLMTLARAVRLESGHVSICFRTEVGSVCVADCIPPSDLTFHHLRGS
ncbi:hypothetical protein AWC38_SpisGene2517, partial [Stylophora pistillata]